MNGLTPKVISEAAKHPLVAVILITLALLYMVQGMIESQDKRYDSQIERQTVKDDKQIEVMGKISESLVGLNNGQDNLVENIRDLTFEIKQLNGNY